MKNTVRVRIAATTAIVLCIGVVTIQASEPCARFIREYREKIAHHHISKATADRWALWGKAHPNYHPKAKPRNPLTSEETYKKVAFACDVPVTPSTLTVGYIPEIDTIEPLDLLTASLEPADVPPPFTLVGAPSISPAPLDIVDTPEPSSFLLLGSGLAALMFAQFSRRRNRIAA